MTTAPPVDLAPATGPVATDLPGPAAAGAAVDPTDVTVDPGGAAGDLLDVLAARVRAVHPPTSPAYDRLGAVTGPVRPLRPLRPLAVVEVTGTAQLVTVLRTAQAHDVAVATDGPGHGGAGDLAGALLVSTRRLDGLEIDPVGRTARVGTGVPWADVVRAAAAHGLVPVCASPPAATVAGYLAGADGPRARAVGLQSAGVRAFHVVTGDGRARRAAADAHPWLFRTLRAGGGVQGVVTAVEIDLARPRPTAGAARGAAARGVAARAVADPAHRAARARLQALVA